MLAGVFSACVFFEQSRDSIFFLISSSVIGMRLNASISQKYFFSFYKYLDDSQKVLINHHIKNVCETGHHFLIEGLE